MVIFYKKWKKFNEIQLTTKNGLELYKNKKSSTLHGNSSTLPLLPICKEGRMVGEREMGGATVMLPYVGHQIVSLV